MAETAAQDVYQQSRLSWSAVNGVWLSFHNHNMVGTLLATQLLSRKKKKAEKLRGELTKIS